MKRTHFLYFELLWPARLVWEAGETPTAPPAPAGPEGDKKPAARPDATEESSAKSAETGKAVPAPSPVGPLSTEAAAALQASAERTKAAAKAGVPNPEEADTFLKNRLAQLLGPPPSDEKAATTADAAPAPEKKSFPAERVAEVFNRNKEKFQKFIKDFLQNPNGLMDGEKRLTESVQTADREVVEYMLRGVAITDEEDNAFKSKFQKPDAIMKEIAEGSFSPREFFLALSYIRREDIDLAKGQNLLTPVEADNLNDVLLIIPRESFAQKDVDEVLKNPAYKAAYDAFLKDGKEGVFLGVFEKDAKGKKVMELYLNCPVTKQEMEAMQAELKSGNKKMPQNPAEIDGLVTQKTLTYRDGLVLKEILHNVESKAAAEGSTLEDDVKKVGFMELLERLIDKLDILAKRIGDELDKFLNKGKQAKAFPNSPVGKNQKVTVVKPFNKDHPSGIDLKAEQPNQQVTAVVGGIVSDVGGNKITIATQNAKITYTGIAPAGLIKGKAVDAGTVLGQIAGDTFNLQVTDPDGKQQYDPRSLLKPEFVKEEAKAAPAGAGAEEKKAEGPPAGGEKPATGGAGVTPGKASETRAETQPSKKKLSGKEEDDEKQKKKPTLAALAKFSPVSSTEKLTLATYTPSNPSYEGVIFVVTPGTSVQSILEGGGVSRISKDPATKSGIVEVTYPGYIITYAGLHADNMIKAPEGSTQQILAGAKLGEVDNGGNLTIKVTKTDGTTVDPRFLLAQYMENPPASTADTEGKKDKAETNTSPPPEVPADQIEDES